MKTPFSVALDRSTQDSVRALAKQTGAAVGDLTDFLLRSALGSVSPEIVQQWAIEHAVKVDRTSSAMTKAEGGMLGALQALRARSKARAYASSEVANEAGLAPRDVWRAGQTLSKRGLVAFASSLDLDSFGRPVESIWWLTADPPLVMVDADLLEGVSLLRAWVETLIDPADRASVLQCIECEIGLSDRALSRRVLAYPRSGSENDGLQDWRGEFRRRFGRYFPIPETLDSDAPTANDADVVEIP